ncbi:MAG TPA: hypothetical protein PLK77_18810 [Pyrinomonadaceae bacterium]|nr:hypothetical protein [Pyrinomonadaceae bacterium]
MEKRYDSPLANLKVASPCSADWERMAGDDRKRFCGDCKLHVYNLSGMTKYDAENLLRLSEGRLCVRYFQRADGTVLTQECPVGWAKVRRRLSLAATAAFGMLLSIAGIFGVTSSFGRKNIVMGDIKPYTTPTPQPTPDAPPLMGAIAMPSPTPRVSPSPKDQPLMGKPVIKDELREKVLRQAGI